MVILGCAGRTTIAEAVQTIADATGTRSQISARRTDRSAFLIDSGKAQRAFNFDPTEILAALRRFVSDNS
jgi:nucleoside-diphosphate-sugar epimerase